MQRFRRRFALLPVRRPVSARVSASALWTFIASVSVLAAAGAALAQPGAVRSVTYPVAAVDGSGVSGVVFVGDFGAAGTGVVVALRGTAAGGDHPAHFHAGGCGSGGGIVVPLANVRGDSGLGVSWVDTPFDAIVEGDHYLNVHRSPDDVGTIVACGEVGLGATPGTARTPARPEEFETPRLADYALSPVGMSGVAGSVQVLQEVDGPTSILVSLTGIDPTERFPLALYRGDCGPDRELVTELIPTSGRADVEAPNTSRTVVELSFDEITGGDHFLYVFAPGEPIDRPADFGLDGEAVACGEVGAN